MTAQKQTQETCFGQQTKGSTQLVGPIALPSKDFIFAHSVVVFIFFDEKRTLLPQHRFFLNLGICQIWRLFGGMEIIFDGQKRSDWSMDLLTVQRAMYYGDGVFESMCMADAQVPLLVQHLRRLQQGLEVLGIQCPDALRSPDDFGAYLTSYPHAYARLRLCVWRAAGGLYRPTHSTGHWMLTVVPQPGTAAFESAAEGVVLGVCTQVRLPMDAVSGFKTFNAPRYVIAAREAEAAGWDDALLLNAAERVCEATSSNVFWWRDGVLYTPPLSEGCVDGVMRGYLLRHAPTPATERVATVADLLGADELFLTNAVRGIIPVRALQNKTYPHIQTPTLSQWLKVRVVG
jgi:branched-subunit amino acid aminotransferase/4-amino-4-deoxychorismate lyase